MSPEENNNSATSEQSKVMSENLESHTDESSAINSETQAEDKSEDKLQDKAQASSQTRHQANPQRLDDNKLKNILEAALMAVAKPMSIEQLMKLFVDEDRPSASRVKTLLKQLQDECEGRGIELKDIASGYRYQSRQDYATWISRLYEERPAKYSRAYLETLALIAYRQPVTRAEIEDVRGVGVSSSIIKTMVEREWIRVVGHRDVPGRPSLYATTKQFLDYFNMKSLDELPSLAEIKDLEDLNPELELPEPGALDESVELNHLTTDDLTVGTTDDTTDDKTHDLSDELDTSEELNLNELNSESSDNIEQMQDNSDDRSDNDKHSDDSENPLDSI